MSLRSLGVRRALAVAGAGSLVAAAAAAPAQGATLSQTYSCLYPLISSQPLSVNIDAAIPTETTVGEPTGEFNITANATTNDTTWDGLNLVQAKTIEGTAVATSSISAPGFSLPLAVPVDVPVSPVPATRGPINIVATGKTPSLVFPQEGTATITVDALRMNLKAKKADGTAVIFPPVPGVPDSDGNPETFDVVCTLAPPDQNKKLTDIAIKPKVVENTKPTAPGLPFVEKVEDVTETTAKIQWPASTDDKGVTEYEVRYDDVKIVVPGNQTSTTLTGLQPGGEYFVTVVARDEEGLESDPSEELQLLTLESTDAVPSAPTNLKGTPTANSVELSWDASTDDGEVVGYEIFQDDLPVKSVTGTTAMITGLTPSKTYKFTVLAKDDADQTSVFSAPLNVTTLAAPDAPPSKPTGLAGTPTKNSVALSWDASTDDNGVTGYDVFQGGVKVASVTGTSATITGLTPETAYQFKVQAKDTKPQAGDFSDEITVTTLADPAPSKPGNLQGTPATTSVSLSWSASTDDDAVTGYDVYKDGVKVTTVAGTSATVAGLTPDTSYAFKVQARDTKPQVGAFSDEITVKTLADSGETVDYGYTLKGSSRINTLTKGNVPLSGTFDAKLKLSTGEFTGNLGLNNTRARLLAFGLIPVSADIAFINTAPTVGTLDGAGNVAATAKFKIRLPKIYLFGSIPLSNSSTCQTREASVATLKNAGAFNPLTGGRLTGTYGISSLTGCGAFTSVLSPLTKGSGNTIDITLAGKAPSAS